MRRGLNGEYRTPRSLTACAAAWAQRLLSPTTKASKVNEAARESLLDVVSGNPPLRVWWTWTRASAGSRAETEFPDTEQRTEAMGLPAAANAS